MKIRNWGDLSHEIFRTDRGLEVETILYCSKFVPRVCLEGRLIACIDWETDLGKVVDVLYKFGFDVEYEEPFNLVEFLKENIEPKKYDFDERNFYFAITDHNNIEVICDDGVKALNCKYFDSINDACYIGEVFENEGVTIDQLNLALEELGWM